MYLTSEALKESSSFKGEKEGILPFFWFLRKIIEARVPLLLRNGVRKHVFGIQLQAKQ